MQTVVGLTHSGREAEQAVRRLQEGGFAPASVGATNDLRSVWRTLVCRPARVLMSHVAVGAVVGIALFAYAGVLVAAGETALGHEPGVAVGVVLALMAAGGVAGGALGLYVGLGDFAGQVHLYVQGLRRGGALAVVHTADEHALRAAAILRQAGAVQVCICPAPRARPFWRRRLGPSTDRLSLCTRWAARLLGLALLAVVALIFVSDGALGRDLPALHAMSVTGNALWVVLLLALAGILVAWRWEGAGGLIIVASILLFQSVNALSGGYWRASVLDPLFYLTGLLFLWNWWRTAAADSSLSLPNP